MPDKLDFEQPLALRRDPRTKFEGEIIGPDVEGDRVSLVDGFFCTWSADGRYAQSEETDLDLIPLSVAPAKWKSGWATIENTKLDDPWGYMWNRPVSSFDPDGEVRIHMVEKAAGDTLVEAIEITLKTLKVRGQSLPMLENVLKGYKERLEC